jgi:hypothetical protein
VPQPFLAVINQAGQVWARTLSSNQGMLSVGSGFLLAGPTLFGGPDDQFVLGSRGNIAVVTRSGNVWNHRIPAGSGPAIEAGMEDTGSLFGGPDAQFVLYSPSGVYYVVTTAGKVWAHTEQNGAIGGGTELSGPGLFGAPNQKYVLYDPTFSRILVINTSGNVWAHDLTSANGIGGGTELSGPSLFGAPNDKYAVLDYFYENILIINTSDKYGHIIYHNRRLALETR